MLSNHVWKKEPLRPRHCVAPRSTHPGVAGGVHLVFRPCLLEDDVSVSHFLQWVCAFVLCLGCAGGMTGVSGPDSPVSSPSRPLAGPSVAYPPRPQKATPAFLRACGILQGLTHSASWLQLRPLSGPPHPRAFRQALAQMLLSQTQSPDPVGLAALALPSHTQCPPFPRLSGHLRGLWPPGSHLLVIAFLQNVSSPRAGPVFSSQLYIQPEITSGAKQVLSKYLLNE